MTVLSGDNSLPIEALFGAGFAHSGRAENQAVGGVIEPAIVIRQLHQRGGIKAWAVLKLKVGQTFYGG